MLSDTDYMRRDRGQRTVMTPFSTFVSARLTNGHADSHDNDRKVPRTPAEIYDLNRHVAAKMKKIFHSVPVVPSLGMFLEVLPCESRMTI